MEKKLKHLEFIQGIINRLATNSFRLKRWAVILVSALLVLIVREGTSTVAFVGLVPVIAFWGLDGYFLWQERLFRDLYDRVRVLEEEDIDFSMDTRTCNQYWFRAVFSTTLSPFYVSLVAVVVVTAMVGR